MAIWVIPVRRCGSVPVLLAGRKPDHVARPDLLDRPAPALRPAAARRDEQGLAERMRMPRSPRTRLESDAGALNQRRIRRLKQRIDTDRAGEPIRRSLDGSLRANSLDVHFRIVLHSGRSAAGHPLQRFGVTRALHRDLRRRPHRSHADPPASVPPRPPRCFPPADPASWCLGSARSTASAPAARPVQSAPASPSSASPMPASRSTRA